MGYPKRILVSGTSGAGKTTLAEKLSREFDLPLISYDEIAFDENHNRLSPDVIESRISDEIQGEKLVFDGLFKMKKEYVKEDDILIFVDVGKGRHYLNMIKRKARKMHRLFAKTKNKGMVSKQVRTLRFVMGNTGNLHIKWKRLVSETEGVTRSIYVKNLNKNKIDSIIEKIRNLV